MSSQQSSLTKQDWVAIHKKAFEHEGFRDLLEKNPTEAINQWIDERRREGANFAPRGEIKIVNLSEWVGTKEELACWDFGPPTCC